jgi:hypothetical protein
VVGIFWTNSIEKNKVLNADISLLDWNERLIIDNSISEDKEQVEKQLNEIADNTVIFLANRTGIS